MKILRIILLLTIFGNIIFCKKDNVFKLTIEQSDKNFIEELKKNKFNDDGKLYDDKNYEIWKSCSGEWGGTIYFKSKLSNKIYSAISTCPISVNKIKNDYYVSNNLNHMIGFSNILKINNPTEMKETSKIPKYSEEFITREFESNSTKGTKKILDSTGIEIISSFVYQNHLYSIISNHTKEETTVSKIKNGKFVTVLDLTSKINFHSEPIILKNGDDMQKIFFQYPKKGTLEIKSNELKITYFEK